MFGPMAVKMRDKKTGEWVWLHLPQEKLVKTLQKIGDNHFVNADKKPKLLKVWTSGEKEMVRK